MKLRYYLLAVSSMLLAFKTLWGPWQMRELLLADYARVEEEMQRTRTRIEFLQTSIRQAKSKNPKAIEHMVRDELGWTDPKKNEIIIDFNAIPAEPSA